MGAPLDYATPATRFPARRWPLVLVAVGTAAVAAVMLVIHCSVGIADANATSRSVRHDAWARVLITGPSCLLAIALGWWVAKRVRWQVCRFRQLFWICCIAWLVACALMAVRLAA